ncbi:MAG: peptidoglycan DD-metalloendopeptidase family protein, partial [Pyrinomonadaceae bacterium]
YRYDPLGRIIQLTLPDGNPDQNTNTKTALYAGTVTTITDEAGKQRRQTVDALGRVVQIDEPDSAGALNQSTTYTYNVLDALVKITQGEQARYFKYDSLSRMTHERLVEQDAPHQQADALTGNNWWSRKNVYNEYGLTTDSWDARGIHMHLAYDGLNRLKQVTYDGETATTTPTITYTYDEARQGYFNRGKLTTVATAAVSGTQTDAPPTVQAYDYDRMGRITSQRQTVGATTYTLGYAYNLAGLLTSQTYPSGRILNTSYDAASRLASLTDGAGQTLATNFAYSGHGGLQSETWGNGAVHTTAYNDRLNVSQIKLVSGGTERQRFDYSYGEINVDSAALDTGRNTGQVASVDGWIDGVKQWQQRYAYDKLGRLSTAKELNNDLNGSQAWRVDYTYDRHGNRYQGAGQGSIPVAWEDVDRTRNRYVSTGSTLMIYDGAGNLTIDQKFRGLQYTYDANGRMRRTDGTTQYAIATYDGVGQRAQHYESGITRQSVYDIFGRLVADYENGSWKRDYVYRGGGLLATIDGTGARYVLTDHQGSTRAVMNGGQVTERHDYRPFGEEIGAYTGLRTIAQGYNAQNPVRQQYALTERDQSTGMDHTLWRKHEPFSGRWTSPDPYRESLKVRDPQSLNRYSYVENDPVNFIDPSGLEWVPIIQKACVTTGTVEGADDPLGPQTVCTYRIMYVWMNQPGGYQGQPQEPHVRCGVNPITNSPGFTREPRGIPGHIRPGTHGEGHFGAGRLGNPAGHQGLDITGVPNTTPVYANRGGTVVTATGTAGEAGWLVEINHGGGVVTRYVHLQANSIPAGVTVGQRVEQGQQIGVVGNTGNAADLPVMETHLHFGVRINGLNVNPETYLNNPCP